MKRKRDVKQKPHQNTYERTYDKSAKNVLATRQFLAMILHERVPEFRPFSMEVIERDCIDGMPRIDEVLIDPGQTNRKRRPQKIRGLNTEQSDRDEGYITFDILFYAIVPGTQKRIKLLINIEAQRSDPSYNLFSRAWFYLNRLVSSQKERDFTGQDYDSICKVYTIWLCFYLPEGEESSITSYKIQPEQLVGRHQIPKSSYDLMNITILHIGDDEEDDTLIKFLRLVFLSQWTEQELARKLQDEFGMKPNDETRKELDTMCNLSIGLVERAEARGEARGEVRGEARGKMKGEGNIILNMLRDHAPLAFIQKYSGWTADDIRALAQQNGLAVE